jgi:hypothetical protein
MGHKDFPLGDTVPLCQRKSNAVDIFLKGSSGMSIRHREGKEKKRMTLISTGNAPQEPSPAKRV